MQNSLIGRMRQIESDAPPEMAERVQETLMRVLGLAAGTESDVRSICTQIELLQADMMSERKAPQRLNAAPLDAEQVLAP